MLRLITFDGVALTQDGGVVSAVQNRRQSLALLLILAARGTRGIARDEAMRLLWPDGTVRDPRHSLDQLLSVTRAAAGGAPLVNGAGALRLDPNGVRSDVDDFAAARRAGRREEMAALYHAPFAEGFGVGASAALERFLDDARRDFAREHADALRKLADAAEAHGDHAEAARWWHRLQQTDRLDAGVAVKLVTALAAADRSGEALRAATAYAALLRAEHGREHAEITRWVQRLGAAPASAERSAGLAHGTPAPQAHLATAGGATGAGRAASLLQRAVGGRYRLERVLRHGTIFTTYLGVDGAGTYGTVEVHVLAEVVAATAPADHFAAVFRRVVALSHAHVLPTRDAGADGALRYVVTARRPDDTLDGRLARERQLPLRDAVALGHDLAAALAHAHERGVHHGDVRPKRVAVAGGRACVYAFGFAESVAAESAGGDSAVLTLGSTVYHSPEQLRGEVRVDARSDVYAFGCVLFEMLAGEPPFGGRAGPTRSQKLTQAARPVRELRDTVPEALAAVVRTCLERVPADRYASGEALLRAMGAVRERA